MLKLTKAQVATEFFLYAGVFLLIVILTFGLVSFMQESEIQFRESIVAKEVGETFSDAISLAIRSGQGFRYNMTFKKTLLSRNYEVIFDDANGRIFFNWMGTYGEISNLYYIPSYDFRYLSCMSPEKKLKSDDCKNTLSLYNNGSTLFVEQPA